MRKKKEFSANRETRELQNIDRTLRNWRCMHIISELGCTSSQFENKRTYDHALGFDDHNYRLEYIRSTMPTKNTNSSWLENLENITTMSSNEFKHNRGDEDQN